MKKLVFVLWLSLSYTFLFAQTINYAYDNLGRLTQVNYPDGSIVNYTYDASGNRVTAVTQQSPLYDANLINLQINSGTLSPSFSSTINSYTASVPNSVSSITVTPTTSNASATVKINGASVASGTASSAILLNAGPNIITTIVTAKDGATTNTYITTVTRAASSIATLSGLTLSAAPLLPSFATGTTTYTAKVLATVTSITETPTTTDPTASITVNGATVASGSASRPINLSIGPNVITTVVTAQDGTTTGTYTTTVYAGSNNAALSNIALSSGTLSPAFKYTTTGYTASVANSVSSITVTPSAADATATITVNGTAVASKTASGPIALSVGQNTITVTLASQNGLTTDTYTITVTRAPSAIATLSALTLSEAPLLPAFASNTTSYIAKVLATVTSITATPTTTDPAATVKVNGAAVPSGAASAPISLSIGPNAITTVVTAQDGITTDTYSIIVYAGSNNAALSSIALSSGTLSPAFKYTTTNYTANVSNSTASITVTPAAADPTATIKVNGTVVASKTASGPIALSVGQNIITVVLASQNGLTTDTYTITVTRAPSNIATLSAFTLSGAPLSPAFASATTRYTAKVLATVTSITATPTTTDPTATVKVNGTPVISGKASGPISLNIGPNAVSTVVTAQDGITTNTYSTIVYSGSNNAALSNLSLSSGTLSPAFKYTTLGYTASVANSIASITVTPTAADPTATIKVNGAIVTSKTASGPIALSVGQNIITVVLASQNGLTTDTYTITVTRAPSPVATLSALTTNNGTLTPIFASATNNYTVQLGATAVAIKVTPTSTDAAATIKVNGASVSSGAASSAISLNAGLNIITIVVTAQDGVTTDTYAINVYKGSPNAALSNLSLSSGTLSPVFNYLTYHYTANVSNATASITVTPNAADATATITVNGIAVTSKTASGPIALAVGTNTITTIVRAQNGLATETYTVVVTRAVGSGDGYDTGISVSSPTDALRVTDDGITVHKGVSPNGDGIDDYLQIDNISGYPDNKLIIMNRNGQLIYEAKGYDNSSKVFDGHSNKNGQMQLPGTYFYQLDYTVSGIIKHKTGFLVLKY